ncbi:hypothetical protein Tco_1475726 [Tanacetum coccineum]
MTKVIKGEFEKIKDVKVEDVSLTCDTPLEVFNKDVSRLRGLDNDLFTFEVEVANILCNSKMDDDSEHEVDDDMGYDPSDVAFTEWLGEDDEVKLTDEESSDDEDEIAETYEDYKDDWIYEWNKDVPWVYDKPWLDNGIWKEPTPVKHSCKPFNYKTGCSEWPTCSWIDDGYYSELKDEALRNKAIMEEFIKEDDDESRYEQMRLWNIYTNYDNAYEINHEDTESKELCEVHELSMCNYKEIYDD